MTSELSRYFLPRRPSCPDATKPHIVLGAMNFGKRTAEAEAAQIIDRAWERGIRMFDTANMYNDGESERILGRALKHRPDAAIATKVGLARISGRTEGLSATAIRRAVEESLSRLGRDVIDLYYMHAPDHQTPLLDSLHAMGDLKSQGKIREVGCSNFASWQMLEMLHASQASGLPAPKIAQQLYNLLIRQLDLEYFRFAKSYGIHTTVYNPLAGGLLSGRYSCSTAATSGSRFDGNRMYLDRYFSATMIARASRYAEVAADCEVSLVKLAYSWLSMQPGVDSILIGPATLAHLDDALSAMDYTLPDEAMSRISAIHLDAQGTNASYAR